MRSAIIDIGYNTIRAVVFDRETLGAPEIFNDKFKRIIKDKFDIDNKKSVDPTLVMD